MNYYDAHNHLQDDRFAGRQSEMLATCASAGVVRMVVNGACEADWPEVLALARANPLVLPSFGYHPWYLAERTPDWAKNLETFLDAVPSAVGEMGLDRWKSELPYAGQEDVFLTQLRIAAERNLPVSIHCQTGVWPASNWGTNSSRTKQRRPCTQKLRSASAAWSAMNCRCGTQSASVKIK